MNMDAKKLIDLVDMYADAKAAWCVRMERKHWYTPEGVEEKRLLTTAAMDTAREELENYIKEHLTPTHQ